MAGARGGNALRACLNAGAGTPPEGGFESRRMHWEFRGQVEKQPPGQGEERGGSLRRCARACPRLRPVSVFPLLQISPTK